MDLHFKPREGGWSSGRLYYGREKPDHRLYYGGVPLTYLWRANIFSRAKDRIERIDARLARQPENPGAFRRARNWYSSKRKEAAEYRVVSLAKKLTASESDVNAFISNQVKGSDLIPDDGDFLRRLDGCDCSRNGISAVNNRISRTDKGISQLAPSRIQGGCAGFPIGCRNCTWRLHGQAYQRRI
ncbi:MAG: hypothetical protein WC861_06090 [Candidatus Micrarchaeia archaeon]